MTTPTPGSQPPAPPSYPSSPPSNLIPPKNPRAVAVPQWAWWVGAGVLLALVGVFFAFYWRGHIAVVVTPPTAEVSLGETNGIGTVTLDTRPGTYRLSAKAAGYIPFQSDVAVGRNEHRDVTLTLRQPPKAQELNSQIAQFMVLDENRQSLLYLAPAVRRVERLFLKDLESPDIDAITPDRFQGVTTFQWSPDRQLVLYRDANGLHQYDFNRYDLVNQTNVDWPAEVKAIDWRPDGEKVAYVYHDQTSGERTLVRATKRNEEPERIFNFATTAITNPELRWSPDAKSIALWETNLFVLDVFTAELRQLDIGEPVTAVRWSPTSDRLLYETTGGLLGTVSLDGTKDAGQFSGPIGRAAFTSDGKALVVAKGRGASLELTRIDLASGTPSPYYVAPGDGLEPTDLMFGENDQQLFFTSAGRPYVLNLDDGTYPAP